MKKIIYSIILFLNISLSAQTFNQVKIDSTSGEISFDEIVPIDSVDKNELYSRSKEWFVNNFKSANSVLQMDDKELGKLIGKGYQDIYIPTIMGNVAEKMYYTISIYIKNNKIKYSISNITYKAYPDKYNLNPQEVKAESVITDESLKSRTKVRTKYKIETLSAVNKLSQSIKSGVTSKSKSNKGDW